MKIKLAGAALTLSLAACATMTLEDLALRCDAYGFKRNTDQHAACLQREVRAHEVQQAEAGQRFQNSMRALQQLDAPPPPESYTAPAASGPLIRSYISGPNRICVYNVSGNATARTLPMSQMCPQWGN